MQIQCPKCQKTMAAADEHAGLLVRCPSCGGQMQLPTPNAAAVAAPVAPVAHSQPQAAAGPQGGQSRQCPFCGEQILAIARKCKHCGSMLSADGYGPGAIGSTPGARGAVKSKIVAGLLGVFLGGWGVHRFYLGYIGIGIAQIVVTLVTCGIGSVWGLIEGILILTGSSITTDANGRPLRD
jgi:TM2 domain-containing membrane protein YozV/ribosomal protein S27E